MDTRFTEIDGQDVKACFPRFYDKQGRFFEIVYKGQPIGFVGIRSLEADCELEAFVFKACRNALTKGIVLATLDLPKSLGFNKCRMKTTLKTVVKLLKSMGKYGVMPLGLIDRKHVFVREFP